MKTHVKVLEALVVYIFFFGLATGSLGLSAWGYFFANKDMGWLAILNLVIMIVSGYLGVSCYKGLREELLSIDASLPKEPPGQGMIDQ